MLNEDMMPRQRVTMTRDEAIRWMHHVVWAAADVGAGISAGTAEDALFWLHGASVANLNAMGADMRRRTRRAATIHSETVLRVRLTVAAILCAVRD